MLTDGSRVEYIIKCDNCNKDFKREHNLIVRIKKEYDGKFLCIDCRVSNVSVNSEEQSYYMGLLSNPTSLFLNQIDKGLIWAYLRGHFEKNGEMKDEIMACTFTCSNEFFEKLHNVCDIEFDFQYYTENVKKIIFEGTNCLDFCSKLYDNSDPKYRNHKFYSVYMGYCNLYKRSNLPLCKFLRTSNDAFSPVKNRASDEGYDLWVISVDKKISDVTTRYDTGLIIVPQEGFHIEILPRSSLSNSGYMLSNSIGLIDSSYLGNLKVCLTKVDPNAKDIQLPFKGVQIILRPSIHYLCQEIECLDVSTTRGKGGFGSTDKKQE